MLAAAASSSPAFFAQFKNAASAERRNFGFDVGNFNCLYPGFTADSRSSFHRLCDIFEGNNKHLWLDLKAGWCHLCQEPIGGTMGIHLSDRDHICLSYFLHLFASYPRRWEARKVLLDAKQFQSGLHRACTTHTTADHLHSKEDAIRRAELQSLFTHLSEPPHCALPHSLHGRTPMAYWVSGERTFKVNVTKLLCSSLPPMSAGMLSYVAQKCWGRSNLERLYDALNFETVLKGYKAALVSGREKKAFFVRSVLWELICSEVREDTSPVTHALIHETLKRVSMELVYLQTMQYMNRIQDLVEKMGYPQPKELFDMGLT